MITKELLIKRTPVLLVVAILAAVVGAGCGDSSGAASYNVVADTTVTTASFPKAQLVPRINKICRNAWGTILDNFTEFSRWQDPKMPERKRFEEAVQLSLTAGIVFHVFDSIYRMGAPPSEKRRVEEIIGAQQSASERGQKGLAPVSSIAQVEELYGEYNQLARSYGLDECLVDEARLKKLELGP